MADQQKVGEVIEACTRDYIAQCYELYQSPALGSLVKSRDGDCDIYGVVYNVVTGGLEPGRRAIARGKDEENEENIYNESPQLLKLLKSEFSVLLVGYRKGEKINQCLPPRPAHIHAFVHICTPEEVKQFSRSFDFLNILLNARPDISVEELVAASLREMSRVYDGDRRSFLVSAGKELASLLPDNYAQLKVILKGLKYDAA